MLFLLVVSGNSDSYVHRKSDLYRFTFNQAVTLVKRFPDAGF
jgi:hypothetical protein